MAVTTGDRPAWMVVSDDTRREVAVEGWRPVEDLIRWGFAHAPVVMANEAHDGVVVFADNELTR